MTIPPTLREVRRGQCARLLAGDPGRAALAVHGTPVLLLEPERVRRQYRRLRAALPSVRFHYAVKALAHDAVISVLAEEGCSFDVATTAELNQVLRAGVPIERTIHTHPIKKVRDIQEALHQGVRTFVVDNETEIDKFIVAPADTRLLVRLAYRSPQAKSDLSTKFGVGPFEAARLVAHALSRGIRIAGFSFHVGSQLDDPNRFVRALTDTLDLMDRLQSTLPVRFDTLDIGGGFPIAYDSAVQPLEAFAAALRPVLEERACDLDVIAEPGRILVAEAMTLVTSVVGIAERSDGRWYYLDDGVHGSYSNVLAEDVHPLVFAASEFDGDQAHSERSRWITLAGPTCDSVDVIAREMLLPELVVGDLVVSPAMGAYTAATATTFNGLERTPIAVLGIAPATGEVATVAADVVGQTVP